MRWFDREFDFATATGQAEAICHRLRHAPAKTREFVSQISPQVLNFKRDGTWSIKEHIGHLCLLEPLWRVRFEDIRERKQTLTPADLDNKATNEANFNNYALSALLDLFLQERSQTLSLVATLDLHDGTCSSLHPRLNQQMRLIDNAWFIAEHDEHHLAAIREIGLRRDT